MKKVFVGAVAAVVALSLTSCSMTLPVAATSNPIGTKVGRSSGNSYLHLLYFGVDASIQTAAKNAGITKVSTVDIKHTDILGLIQTHEVIVTGE